MSPGKKHFAFDSTQAGHHSTSNSINPTESQGTVSISNTSSGPVHVHVYNGESPQRSANARPSQLRNVPGTLVDIPLESEPESAKTQSSESTKTATTKPTKTTETINLTELVKKFNAMKADEKEWTTIPDQALFKKYTKLDEAEKAWALIPGRFQVAMNDKICRLNWLRLMGDGQAPIRDFTDEQRNSLAMVNHYIRDDIWPHMISTWKDFLTACHAHDAWDNLEKAKAALPEDAIPPPKVPTGRPLVNISADWEDLGDDFIDLGDEEMMVEFIGRGIPNYNYKARDKCSQGH